MPGPAPTPGRCPFGGHPSRLFFRRKAAPEQSGVLGLGPPRLRWAAAGLARRPCLRLGLAPGLGPCGPLGRACPGSGPLRSLWVAAGVAAACRRAACARRRGPGAPPAAPAAAWAGPGVGGLASPPPRPPAWGSCGPPCAPLRARCGGARPWAAPGGPSPRPRRAGSPLAPPLSGGPAIAMGRRRCVPPGGGWGAAEPPLCAAAAPRTSGRLDKNKRSIISYDCGQNGGKQAERWKNGGEF